MVDGILVLFKVPHSQRASEKAREPPRMLIPPRSIQALLRGQLGMGGSCHLSWQRSAACTGPGL